MELADLPPDIAFRRLDAALGDIDFAFAFAFAFKRWSWDEAFQRDLHERRFGEKPFFEIRRAGQPLGTVSFQVRDDHVRFGELGSEDNARLAADVDHRQARLLSQGDPAPAAR